MSTQASGPKLTRGAAAELYQFDDALNGLLKPNRQPNPVVSTATGVLKSKQHKASVHTDMKQPVAFGKENINPNARTSRTNGAAAAAGQTMMAPKNGAANVKKKEPSQELDDEVAAVAMAIVTHNKRAQVAERRPISRLDGWMSELPQASGAAAPVTPAAGLALNTTPPAPYRTLKAPATSPVKGCNATEALFQLSLNDDKNAVQHFDDTPSTQVELDAFLADFTDVALDG